ncbi:hypothetical protein ACKGJO_06750 [Gracilimonas sp. Q87]|uniref:hypothetical protein n=1 Tax=Gracilimonas sp. Q87 TaxID=3384766 RepID=UPI003983F965
MKVRVNMYEMDTKETMSKTVNDCTPDQVADFERMQMNATIFNEHDKENRTTRNWIIEEVEVFK